MENPFFLQPAGTALLFKRVKVDTVNLEPGMFVAQLDRPWLETPFFFQGFEIRQPDEIGLLRKFCKHVYIDVERSSVPKERVLEAHNSIRREYDPFQRDGRTQPAASASGLGYRLLSALARFDPTGRLAGRASGVRRYQNLVSTRDEAPKAAHAYGLAMDAMDQVLKRIYQGKGIDVLRVKRAAAPIVDSILRNQDAMAWLVSTRKNDDYTYNHSIASAIWAVILGRHLGFDRSALQTLAMGGLLLDVGKACVEPAIVDKATPLTAEEQQQMRKHVEYSTELARRAPGINDQILNMISAHHERHDGSGYPRGLAGNDIPVFGRIAGLVDSYDAMITTRAHVTAMSPYDAIRELNLLAGTKFQKELVEQFVQALGMFPTGSIVELNTGEIGIVVEQNRVHRLRPKVLVVLDAQRHPVGRSKPVDLKRRSSDPNKRNALWIVQGCESGAFGIDPGAYFK